MNWFRRLIRREEEYSCEKLARMEEHVYELELEYAKLLVNRERLAQENRDYLGHNAQLQAETIRLEELPTTKKLRATIKAMETTRAIALTRVQEAEKAAEDAAYREEMALHMGTRTGTSAVPR